MQNVIFVNRFVRSAECVPTIGRNVQSGRAFCPSGRGFTVHLLSNVKSCSVFRSVGVQTVQRTASPRSAQGRQAQIENEKTTIAVK